MVILGNRPNILLAANSQHVSKPKANIMGEVEHYLQTYTFTDKRVKCLIPVLDYKCELTEEKKKYAWELYRVNSVACRRGLVAILCFY